MKCLIVGNGGREHAIGWSLSQDPRIKELHFAPGNAGTAELGHNLPIPAGEIPELLDWCRDAEPDLVVVGPEAPLCLGLVDALAGLGIPAFGPDRDCARLEGSKVFSKDLLNEAGIPTARSERFDDCDLALKAARNSPYPLVIKADGLAAGKGVIIAQNPEEAEQAIRTIMETKAFGDAGNEILIEEFLEGEEASIHAVTDGEDYVLFPSSQDHKRIGEGDRGPNTGGMGAYAPAPVVTAPCLAEVERLVFRPLLETMKKRGLHYRGVLYGGLMLTAQGPKVLEFNCRFGDPETQVILPLLETPLLDVIQASIRGEIGGLNFQTKSLHAMTVVLAAPGYPESPEKGGVISGLEKTRTKDQILFHAGTASRDGAVVTSGGRVLAATGTGPSLESAQSAAYSLVDSIAFDRMQFRRDIGYRALTTPQPPDASNA
jgi:phosphoribosylamine--glycine ligase